MNIILHRTDTHRYGIDGTLTIDNQRVCNTVENPSIHLAPGIYPIRIHRCPQYRRLMPIVQYEPAKCIICTKQHIDSQHSNLPDICPQIKIGNGAMNRTDGSIIIGDLYLNGVVTNSALHFDRLIDRLDKAQHRGEQISLTIQ